MKHYQHLETTEKLRMWLELCNLSFELFQEGIKKMHPGISAEKKSWTHLKRIMEDERAINRKVFMRMEQ